MRLPKIIVPAIIIIGVVVFQSLFIVQEISQAIVLQFGDPKKIITKAGLNFKLPFIQNVVYLDKRILVYCHKMLWIPKIQISLITIFKVSCYSMYLDIYFKLCFPYPNGLNYSGI